MNRRKTLAALATLGTGGCLRLETQEDDASSAEETRSDDTRQDDGQDGDADAVEPDDSSGRVTEAKEEPDSVTETPTVSDDEVGEYVFSEGERYTYEISTNDDSNNRITWEVIRASGDQLGVRLSGIAPERTYEGTKGEIFQEMRNTQEIRGPFFLLLYGLRLLVEGHSLTPGSSWNVTPEDMGALGQDVDWETGEVRVTGTDSYNGISCATIRFVPDSETTQSSTFCVTPEYPFAIAVIADSDQAGDIVLVESSQEET